MEQPIVIAGAGIAGLALAAGLQRADTATPYLLLEERPELGSAGGAITLWPNAIAALDEIGVGDDVRRAGYPLGAGTISTSRGRVLRSLDLERSAAALGGPLVAVRRGDLIDILHAQIKPGSVLLGIAVRGYGHDSDGVQVLTDGDPIEASALVGADGYRSEIARALHPGLPERYAGYPAWRGIADVGGFDAGADVGCAPGVRRGAPRRQRELLVRHRPRARRRGGRRRGGPPAGRVRRLAGPGPAGPRSDRPVRRHPQRRDGPSAAPSLDRRPGDRHRRRGPRDATAPRPGRLPGAGRRGGARAASAPERLAGRRLHRLRVPAPRARQAGGRTLPGRRAGDQRPRRPPAGLSADARRHDAPQPGQGRARHLPRGCPWLQVGSEQDQVVSVDYLAFVCCA